MAIRNWSLTRYWAMTCSTWLLAFTLLAFLDHLSDSARPITLVALLALTFAPAFWAGTWAGSHPEIAAWPAGRILVMWFLGAGLILLVGDPLQKVGGFAVAAVAAPLIVLSWSWREQRTQARLAGRVVPPIGTAQPPDPLA